MKILILGSDGQLGSEIATKLKEGTHQIIESTIHNVDFKNTPALTSYLNQIERINLIINCVALTNTLYCEENPDEAFRVNAYPLEFISKFCRQEYIPLIHFSTDYVFDGKKNSPYSEDDQTNPLNEYGKSKLEGEKIIQTHLDHHYIIRISSLYGHKSAIGKNTNIIQTIISKAKAGGELKFVNDQLITPTYAKEIACFIEKLIPKMKLKFGIYHLACQGHCSYYELASYITQLLKFENVTITPVSMNDFPAKIKRPQNGTLSSNKISSFYKPAHWQEALCDYFEVTKA